MIFGAFKPTVMPLEEFLGARLVTHVERTLNRPYRILGRCSQMIRCNWKLYAENSRDTYHPSLLHSFATMFKLNRLSAEGGIEMDEAGLHHLVFARRHTDNSSAEYQSQLASVAIRYGGNLLTNAIPKNVLDIVELQTAGYNSDVRTTDPYYYNLLNTRAILGKQIGNQWFVGLSTGLCVVNASNFVENFGLKLEYRFNSIYSAQAGIEPGSSDLTCARSNAIAERPDHA